VDLPLGVATGVAQGIAQIQNVNGSQGNDILVGDANANVLRGGTGRNLLIGGKGADQISGGLQDNILIGGYTTYDQNLTARDAIMKEWTSADSYSARIKAISDGVIGSDGNRYALAGGKGKAVTVFDDAATDVLACTSNPDPNVADWLFASSANDRV